MKVDSINRLYKVVLGDKPEIIASESAFEAFDEISVSFFSGLSDIILDKIKADKHGKISEYLFFAQFIRSRHLLKPREKNTVGIINILQEEDYHFI